MDKGMKKKKFLNVGGNRKDIPVPSYFDGWDHILLDIDPAGNPDIVCDARELQTLEPGRFHAVYCSHNLEHYYHHELSQVLQGFRHVLKPTGFALISVPDMESVIRTVVEQGLDLDDVLYEQDDGIGILVRDVFYGWELQMKLSGQNYYAHKTGFTQKSLKAILKSNGFRYFWVQRASFNLTVVAFLRKPAKWVRELMGLPE
jgi:SAM-dependent methyltransferase